MQFFSWTTDWQQYCRETPKKGRVKASDFITERVKDLEEAGIDPYRLYAENQWCLGGCPYYNVHPKLVSKLCQADLTKIPSSLFQMPHGLDAVNIRFSQQHEEFTVADELTADNCIEDEFGKMPPGSYCRGVLMLDNREKGLFNSPDHKNLLFVMDFGVSQFRGNATIYKELDGKRVEHKIPVYTVMAVAPVEGKTLHDILESLDEREREKKSKRLRNSTNASSESYNELQRKIMRLAVTIGFLSNNPAICEYDVLSKDRSEFQRNTTGEGRKDELIQRAKRKGKFGYNIGNDLIFLGPRPVTSRPQSDASGRELEYAHIRRGHPHAVRYGPNKELVKIMWFAPTTVRDDLPFQDD